MAIFDFYFVDTDNFIWTNTDDFIWTKLNSIDLTVSPIGVSSIPDNVALDVLRNQIATPVGVSSTADDTIILVLRQLIGMINPASSTSDAVVLAVLRKFISSIDASSTTPDDVLLEVLRNLIASIDVTSTTPDDVVLLILRQLIASISTGSTTTDDIQLLVLRLLLAAIEAVSSTSDDTALTVTTGKHLVPAGDAAAIIFEGTIDSWHLDEEKLNFTIVSLFVQWAQKTLQRHAPSCRWKVFGGTECGYVGGETECDRSYARCLELANTDNFGGFRWLPSIVDKEIWWGRLRGED